MFSRLSGYTASFYFFYFWATGVFVIFVPKTLVDIGYSATQIGVLLSVMPLIRFITPFLFTSRLRLTKRVFLYSLLFSTIFFALFAFTYQNFWLLLANTALYGLFITITLPFVDAVALKEIAKERYGVVRLFGSIGFMLVGLVLASGELRKEAVFLHYLISLLFMAIFGALLAKFASDDEGAIEQKEGSGGDFSLYLKDFPFWLAMIFAQFSFGAFYGFFTVFESERGMSMEYISYLWSIGVIAEIVMFAFQGKLIADMKPLFIIKLSLLTLIARWLLLHFFPGNFTIAAIAQTTHAFSFALFTTAAFLFIFSRYADKKKAQMHFYGFSYGLGGFLGSFAAGALYGDHLFLYAAFFAVLSYVFMVGFRVRY